MSAQSSQEISAVGGWTDMMSFQWRRGTNAVIIFHCFVI